MNTENNTPVAPTNNIIKIVGLVIGALALIGGGILIGVLMTGGSANTTTSSTQTADTPVIYGPAMMQSGDGPRMAAADADGDDDGDYPPYGPGMMGGYGYGHDMLGGRGGYGPGMMGNHGEGYGWMADYHDIMEAALADVLGLTVEELQAEFEAGKTVWQIADEQGVDDEVVLEAMTAARDEMIAQALADGVISPEQAEWMQDHEPGDCPMWDDDADGDTVYGGRGPGMMGGRGW